MNDIKYFVGGEEADRRAYHREKTKESRDGWIKLGCKAITLQCVAKHLDWIRGHNSCMTALYLLDMLMTHDETALDELGRRRPKYSVTVEDVDVLRDREAEIDLHCDHMDRVLREMRWHKAQGDEYITLGDRGTYHFAVELALTYYLKGYYDMVLAEIAGNCPTVGYNDVCARNLSDHINLDELRERFPRVL